MTEIVGNMTKLEKEISDSLKAMDSFEERRTEMNAELGAVRAKLEARGIPKKALALARTYLKLDPDEREGFDVAYALVRKAGGLPLQEDLFQAAERKAKEESEKPERPGADPNEIAKVFAAEDKEKTKGKNVLPSSTGTGAIN